MLLGEGMGSHLSAPAQPSGPDKTTILEHGREAQSQNHAKLTIFSLCGPGDIP